MCGVGNLGAPIAQRLVAQFERLIIVDFDHSRAEVIAARIGGGAVAAELGDALGPGDRTLVTCLPTTDVVRSVLESAGLLGGGSGEVRLWVDATSGSPDDTAELGSQVSAGGVVDCAVSGGPAGAAAGSLTAMVGGTEEAVEAAAPVLAALSGNGGRVVHCGPHGSGHAVKCMNNNLLAVNLLAAGEALAALAARGVDPAVAAQAIAASSGRSWAMQQRVPDHVLPRTFDYGFSMGLLAKDARTAVSAMPASLRDSPDAGIMALAHRLCQVAEARLGPEADHTEIVKLAEAAAGALIEPKRRGE